MQRGNHYFIIQPGTTQGWARDGKARDRDETETRH